MAAVRLMIKDNKTAVELFYTYPELGTEQIIELFGCSKSTATRLKEMARKLQDERGILTFSSVAVNTKCAYDAWHIDVELLEKRLIRLKKLEASLS